MAAGLCRTRCAFQLRGDTVRGGQQHKTKKRGKVREKWLIDMLENAAEKEEHSAVHPEPRMRKEGEKRC